MLGTYLTSRSFVPLLKGRPGAQIIGFSGGGAFNPLPRYSAYATSKAGIVRLLETMAEELKPLGIAVNGVAPGFVKTEIHEATLKAGPDAAGSDFHAMTTTKLESGAVPIEVPVNCVRWLISDAARGLTGKTISASFDPWGTPEFNKFTDAIRQSDLYTMRRMNLVNMGQEEFVEALKKATRTKP
jgi:3-oxoacyl-[acyl-carrier protein] reductase